MTPLQQEIVDMVKEPMAVSEIAELLGRTPATIDVTVRKMESEGLMCRDRDPTRPGRYLYWAAPIKGVESPEEVDRELASMLRAMAVEPQTEPEEEPIMSATEEAVTEEAYLSVQVSVPLAETLTALRSGAAELAAKGSARDADLLRRLAVILEYGQ